MPVRRYNLSLAAALAFAPGALTPGAVAQQGTGAVVAPIRPDAGRDMPRAAIPPLSASVEDPVTLIRLAESALAARRLRETAELLERAESRLLTRSELASQADRPAVGGAIGELASARDAITRRDGAGAQGLMASALQRLESGQPPAVVALPGPPVATGNTLVLPPAYGGGAPPLPGIAPQNLPVGGSASPPVPIGPDIEAPRAPPPPGYIPPSSTKPPPL